MKNEPKHSVGDYLIMKLETSTDHPVLSILNVQEILTQTCIAGTQIFYDCRVLNISREIDLYSETKDIRSYTYRVSHHTKVSNQGHFRYREDEVVTITKEHKEIIKKAQL